LWYLEQPGTACGAGSRQVGDGGVG